MFVFGGGILVSSATLPRTPVVKALWNDFFVLKILIPTPYWLKKRNLTEITLVVICFHFLSLVVTRCHSLSFVVARCHSLSLVVPLVFIRCTHVVICCHLLHNSLPNVVTRYITCLSFYNNHFNSYLRMRLQNSEP